MEKFNLKLVSPEGIQFENSVWQLSARNTYGWFGIRAHHLNFLTSIVPCKMEIAVTPEMRLHFMIHSGILDFQHSGTCTIISEEKIERVQT
ncbi:MAG: F0F1 ATP synthase subunit epsilon [Fibrobacter sp.]|nr:F0F1 ATP synthase subunit epsilon [Fibrobacter sp.]